MGLSKNIPDLTNANLYLDFLHVHQYLKLEKKNSAGYSSDRKSVIELMFKYNLIQNALQISLLPR